MGSGKSKERDSPVSHMHWWMEVQAKDYSEDITNTVASPDGSLFPLNSAIQRIYPPSLPFASGCSVAVWVHLSQCEGGKGLPFCFSKRTAASQPFCSQPFCSQPIGQSLVVWPQNLPGRLDSYLHLWLRKEQMHIDKQLAASTCWNLLLFW